MCKNGSQHCPDSDTEADAAVAHSSVGTEDHVGGYRSLASQQTWSSEDDVGGYRQQASQPTGSLKRPRTHDLCDPFIAIMSSHFDAIRVQRESTIIKQPDPLEILAGLGPESHRYNSVCHYVMIVWSDRFWLRFILASWNDRAQEAYGEKCYAGTKGEFLAADV